VDFSASSLEFFAGNERLFAVDKGKSLQGADKVLSARFWRMARID
jgi:hypothetical protein